MTGPEGSEPQMVQNVAAVNGFAYGVIGADIHVFSSGLPLYLLANWQPEPTADRKWLRELPSRMLNARRAVVPFTGRDGELALLRQWRDSGARLAVRWLHGPGGQGKTRLAAQVAAEWGSDGWKVVAALHGPDADRPEPGSQDMRIEGAAGLLIIVDYADRWLLTNLTWLFKNALLHQSGVVTRVLMVARTASSWPSVRGILDSYQADTSSQHLPALGQESGERSGMFAAALNSFAAVYQLPNAEGIGPPGLLEDSEFGLTLAVHMAALVAIDACATGQRPPPEMAGLTMYLLDREQLHWARLYSDGTAAGATDSTYRTPPEVMNQAVFTAALTGTVTTSVGTKLLGNLQLPSPGQILKDHSICYPSDDSNRAIVLEPLYPDRLAEDFLALTVPGHFADYPAQAWAAATATSLLARDGDRSTPAAWTPRAITFLASAAHRWPHLGGDFLYPMLLRDSQLAVDAGSAALVTIADLPDVSPAVLEAIEARLPDGQHVDLDPGIGALTRRMAEHRLAFVTDPSERASIYHNLGFRLSNAGFSGEALDATQEAVAIRRRLARIGRRRLLMRANPAAYEPDLALSLTNLSGRLAEMGRPDEALAAIQEAVTIRRRLANADPVHEPDLATSLAQLSISLSQLGDLDDALTAAQNAVAIRRRHAQGDAASEQELATSLDNLGIRLSNAGLLKEALTASEEATEILRRMAHANRSVHEFDLARSLVNLAARLAGVGRIDEALTIGQEAATVLNQLARGNPAKYEPYLAMSLNNLGVWLSDVGRREEGLAVTQESVDIKRRLVLGDPTAYEPDLAMSLDNLGSQLAEIGRPEEGLTATQDALAIRRRLAQVNPAAFEHDLAASLNNLGVWLARVERQEEALVATQESVEMKRRLAQRHPDAYEPDLAGSLDNLARRLLKAGRPGEARAAIDEAVMLYRKVTHNAPGTHEPDLARALWTFAWTRSVMHTELIEAFSSICESVRVYQRLTEQNAPAFASSLTDALRTAADVLHGLGQMEGAVLLRRLVETGELDEAAAWLQENGRREGAWPRMGPG